MEEKVVFAVIPDVQIGRERININFWDGWYYFLKRVPTREAVVGKQIEERLERVVDWINSNPEIEFVISIGDITDSATPEQFEIATKILSKLKRPFIPLMGNHDLWPYQRKEKKVIWNAKRPLTVTEFESRFSNWKKFFKNFEMQGGWLQNYKFKVKETRFIIVDNNNRRKAPFGLPGQAGWSKLYPESKEWLKKQIFSSKEKRVIIFSHAPLKMGLLKKLAMDLDTVNISGHTHKRTEKKEEKGRIITTNALYHEPFLLLAKVAEVEIKIEYHKIN